MKYKFYSTFLLKRALKKALLFSFLFIYYSQINYSQVIADHSIIDRFDEIPAYYIGEVKKMWVSIAGESHSQAYRTGLLLLESAYPTYSVSVVESGTPEAYTTSNLRFSRGTWGDVDYSSGWIYSYGEEDWYTNATAIARTKAGLLYCKNNGPALTALGFGWCWDPTWTNGVGGGYDPVYYTRWAGASANGPQGNLRWGLDAGDQSLTGNSVCMDTYINATQSYIDYCTANNISTKIIWTTGPVDNESNWAIGESGYQQYLKWKYIRDHVKSLNEAYFFDYADILSYNDSGVQTTTTWTDNNGTLQTFPMISPENMVTLDPDYHIGTNGAIKLAKAMWWLLARLAGWDGGNTTIWNGSSSNIWNNTANWTDGLPTITSNVLIPKGLANYPVGSKSQDFTIGTGRSMIIESGAQVTLNKITNNGTLWLKSDTSGIASLILGSYLDNGTEKIELYLTGGTFINSEDYKWHYISSPFTYLSTKSFTAGEYPTQDLSAFYENLTTDIQSLAWFAFDGWDYQNEVDTSNEFDSLKVGQGYNYYYASPVTRTFEGTLKTADVIQELSYSGTSDYDVAKGWNLLGNPFSSTLDWDLINKPAGVDNAVYFTLNNTFASYVAGIGIPEGTTSKIPPMQGFFVKANTKTPIQSIILPASSRDHSLQTRYKGEGENIPHIRLKIESQKIYDETVIRFDYKADSAFDSEFDAYKFSKTGTCVSLWTMIGPVSYSINGLPFPEAEVEIPVGINIQESGTFKFSASRLQGLSKYQVYLLDKATGMTANLKTTPAITFTTSEGMVTDRFVIKVINISTGVQNPFMAESKFNIYSSNGQINIQPLSEEWDGEKGLIKVLDITGQTVRYSLSVEFWKNSTVSVSAPIGTGIYFVEILSKTKRFVEKIIIR